MSFDWTLIIVILLGGEFGFLLGEIDKRNKTIVWVIIAATFVGFLTLLATR